jgi:hypothetical protein
MMLSLMTLLVRLECPLGPSTKTVGRPVRWTRMNQSGFDAESHGLRRGAQTITASDDAAKDDERYARDSTEGDNKT